MIDFVPRRRTTRRSSPCTACSTATCTGEGDRRRAVRRGRGRRVRVERRIVPVSASSERRLAVLERELWRIAVEHLNYSEQHAWAALAGARVTPNNWRRAKAMMQHDQSKELRKRFLLTCVQRNRNHQLRLKALGEIAALRDPDSFDEAIDMVGGWSRDDKRAGTILLQALAERRIGRRDQAQAWVWRLASFTRELHEEYAVQRWPETKRLLGLFVNSSGRAHGRNARRIVHAARQHDRRLAVALLAAAVAHTPEAEEALRGARMRTSRKPSAVAREAAAPSRSGGSAGDGARSRAARREAERGRRARPRARRGAGLAGAQLDLPGTEGDPAARLQLDDQVPQWGRSQPQLRGRPASREVRLPRDLTSAQRIALGVRGEHPVRGASIHSPSRSLSAFSACSTLAPCPIDVAGQRRSAGSSPSWIETLSPTPITAHSGGRASIKTPATLPRDPRRWATDLAALRSDRAQPPRRRAAPPPGASRGRRRAVAGSP